MDIYVEHFQKYQMIGCFSNEIHINNEHTIICGFKSIEVMDVNRFGEMSKLKVFMMNECMNWMDVVVVHRMYLSGFSIQLFRFDIEFG